MDAETSLQNVKIFPSIGIARLGNSPEWYLGPELPFPAKPVPPPDGAYKDDQCRIKRQAQRFRLWGFFSDGTDRELTLADGAITWTVHLANAKPVAHAGEPIIDGGLQFFDTPDKVGAFAGSYYGTAVPLGDAEMDSEGRLIVRGGFGASANANPHIDNPLASHGSFSDQPGWYDDVSDGPITAQIVYGGKTITAENGAWVICPPPRFAPSTYAITTLYDTLRQVAITAGQLEVPDRPSFANDIYPILQRALDMRRVAAGAFNMGTPDQPIITGHGTLATIASPGSPSDTKANREAVVGRLKDSLTPGNEQLRTMPLLYDSGTGSWLADFQHTFMQQWSQGQEIADGPPTVPTHITPHGLTRAALETCIGAPFYPGIEAGGLPPNLLSLPFAEPFRFCQCEKHEQSDGTEIQTGGEKCVQPGEVTQYMARPWQSDFVACSGGSSFGGRSWWPSARPVDVFPVDDPKTTRSWTRGVADSVKEMVDNWHQLGFIVDPGDGLAVETERTNVCKSCFFINNRPEIGKAEAQALIDADQSIADGLYVVVQGQAPNTLGITTANPTPAQLNTWAPQIANPQPETMTITPAGMWLEDDSRLGQSQRVTFGYAITFVSTDAFTRDDVPVTIGASLRGMSAVTIIDLTAGQHPYTLAGATSWLNDDLRVFQHRPGEGFAGQTLGSDPNGFITDVITSLRSVSPEQASDWFESLPAGEEDAQLEWSQTIDGQPVYNFAICRVRYRAEDNDAGPVRVFFRLFPAMTTGTDFQPTTTYRTGGQPGTVIPLLGVVAGEVVTIPFFAAPRAPANTSLNFQKDPANIDTLKASVTGQETYSYFGCWIDINQPDDKRFPISTTSASGPFSGPEPLQSIADLIRGTHQSLVAEVNFAAAPIPAGSTTARCDRLAERSLSIDYASTDTTQVHCAGTVPGTDACHNGQQGSDEIMIGWAQAPRGSQATLHLSGATSAEMSQAADRQHSHNRLSRVDSSTVAMEVSGAVSFVPVPPGCRGDLVALLTLDLPRSLDPKQPIRVVMHHVVDAPPTRRPDAVATPRALITAEAVAPGATEAERPPRAARHIRGSFQFSVLVRPAAEILPIAERAQTNIERALNTIPADNRWHPVMGRYLNQVTAKVNALGGGQRRKRCCWVPPIVCRAWQRCTRRLRR